MNYYHHMKQHFKPPCVCRTGFPDSNKCPVHGSKR